MTPPVNQIGDEDRIGNVVEVAAIRVTPETLVLSSHLEDPRHVGDEYVFAFAKMSSYRPGQGEAVKKAVDRKSPSLDDLLGCRIGCHNIVDIGRNLVDDRIVRRHRPSPVLSAFVRTKH